MKYAIGIFILFFLLSGCEHSVCSEEGNTSLLNLDKDEILVFRGVNIDHRYQRKITVVTIEVNDTPYVIPTIERGYSDSLELKKYYHIMEFVHRKGIDTTMAFSYLDSLTSEIVSIFRRAKVKKVFSHPSGDDFITFIPYRGYEMIYKYGNNIGSSRMRFFFDTAKAINGNWYRGACVSD